MRTWVGIDVSMETLDFAWLEGKEKKHVVISNTKEDFRKILKKVPGDAAFVMEATGSYHFNLALFLHEQGRYVAVVNPFQTKSHMRTEMRRTKSDKTDAMSIVRISAKATARFASKRPVSAEGREALGGQCISTGRIGPESPPS